MRSRRWFRRLRCSSGAGHSFDHAVFDLAGFCQSEDFFAFGKAFCVFDVDWYIGIVFLQTVFDGSSYAAGDGVASSCCGCGLGFFRELFAGGWGDAFGVEQAPEFLEGDHEVYITSYGMTHGFQFLGGAWSDEDYFAWGCSFFTIRAVATIGVSSWEMLSIIAGKYFFAMTDQDGQQEVRRNGRWPVATSLA